MRTAEHIRLSALDMQACLEDGLPREMLLTLVLARRALRGAGPWPAPADIAAAVNHPAAARFDQLSIAAIRREIHRWR